MILPVIGRIATLLINPKVLLGILKKSATLMIAVVSVVGLIGLVITATPTPIKMKVGEMFKPVFAPMNTALIIGGTILGILALRELRALK